MRNGFVICKGSSGMGNRILAACTATLYAQITDRNLVIDWRDGSYSRDGINSFCQFFEHTDEAQINNLKSCNSVFSKVWIGQLDKSFGGLKSDLGQISEEEISFDVSKVDYKEDILVFCAYTHKIHKMRDLFQGGFSHLNGLENREILKLILDSDFPVKTEIKEVVNSFKSSQFGTRTVGVHVRQTDMLIPLEKLILKTKIIIRKRQSDCIFLATDNQRMVNIFNQEFDRVVVAPKWFPPPGERMHQNWDACPDRIQNGKEALVDLCLLAECNDLVFSSQSSFGYLASILSNANSPTHLHDISKGSLMKRLRSAILRKLK